MKPNLNRNKKQSFSQTYLYNYFERACIYKVSKKLLNNKY